MEAGGKEERGRRGKKERREGEGREKKGEMREARGRREGGERKAMGGRQVGSRSLSLPLETASLPLCTPGPREPRPDDTQWGCVLLSGFLPGFQ